MTRVGMPNPQLYVIVDRVFGVLHFSSVHKEVGHTAKFLSRLSLEVIDRLLASGETTDHHRATLDSGASPSRPAGWVSLSAV
jgi:hypothetical protein